MSAEDSQCGGSRTHPSGCVDGRWGRPSCGRRSCKGDTWRVSLQNGAWCDAASYPSVWRRHHTGCTGKGVLLGARTQQTHVTARRHHTPITQRKHSIYIKCVFTCTQFDVFIMYPIWTFMFLRIFFVALLSLSSSCLMSPLTTLIAQSFLSLLCRWKSGLLLWECGVKALQASHAPKQAIWWSVSGAESDPAACGRVSLAEWHSISPCSPCPTDSWRSDRTRAFQTQPASSVMHHCLGQFDLKISFFPLLRL